MSTIQEQLNALLVGISANGAYPLVNPGNATYPFVVYQRMPNSVENTMSGNGTPPINSTKFMIKSWGRTYADAVTMGGAVTGAMAGWAVQNVKAHEHDEYDEPTKSFCVIQIYSVWSPSNT